MNLLLDTNVILNILRAKDFIAINNFINPDNALLFISIVTEAELKSFSVRNRWGAKRNVKLDDVLSIMNIIDINQLSVNIYADIDAYSQRSNPNFESYPFDTPRNMGKNDLWIASLAALLGLKLVTTDTDFDHLHNIFFEVARIDPVKFAPFF
ncbi:MAG TPA: type II toxin-antitoxin system VapC family toxin [Mucilaginibacter sp.]|nr:type II toxin-antitoxin system VapC family toxin [Mucilaginibacter sp.]